MEGSQFIFQSFGPYFKHKLHAHQVILLSRHKMENMELLLNIHGESRST